MTIESHITHLHDERPPITSGGTTTLYYLSRHNMTAMVTNSLMLHSTRDKSLKKAELKERLMKMDQEK